MLAVPGGGPGFATGSPEAKGFRAGQAGPVGSLYQPSPALSSAVMDLASLAGVVIARSQMIVGMAITTYSSSLPRQVPTTLSNACCSRFADRGCPNLQAFRKRKRSRLQIISIPSPTSHCLPRSPNHRRYPPLVSAQAGCPTARHLPNIIQAGSSVQLNDEIHQNHSLRTMHLGIDAPCSPVAREVSPLHGEILSSRRFLATICRDQNDLALYIRPCIVVVPYSSAVIPYPANTTGPANFLPDADTPTAKPILQFPKDG